MERLEELPVREITGNECRGPFTSTRSLQINLQGVQDSIRNGKQLRASRICPDVIISWTKQFTMRKIRQIIGILLRRGGLYVAGDAQPSGRLFSYAGAALKGQASFIQSPRGIGIRCISASSSRCIGYMVIWCHANQPSKSTGFGASSASPRVLEQEDKETAQSLDCYQRIHF
jgi:hypothetical protein